MKRFFLAQSLSTNKSLSDNTKTRFAVSLVEYLYDNMPLTGMLSCLKVAKKHVHIYCFHGKHFTCWDLRGMLKTDNFVQKYSKQTLREILSGLISNRYGDLTLRLLNFTNFQLIFANEVAKSKLGFLYPTRHNLLIYLTSKPSYSFPNLFTFLGCLVENGDDVNILFICCTCLFILYSKAWFAYSRNDRRLCPRPVTDLVRVVRRIHVKIAPNVVKASKLVQMKLIT